jgi:HSP20 family protein
MVHVRQRPFLPELARWEGLTDAPGRFARLFDQMLTPTVPAAGFAFVPVVQLVENDEELLLTAELPGLTEKDVQLEVENNILTLKGEKKQEYEEKNERYLCWERAYGAFERTFAVPGAVDLSKITATFKDGVLEVHMPKTAQAKGRKIEIAGK